VDLRKLKTSDWMKIGGAIGFFIFGFFHWTTVEAAGLGSDSGFNVFHFFLTGTVPWILVIGTGVITLLLAMGKLKPGNVPWPLIMLVATGLAAFLLLIRLIFNPVDGKDLIESVGGSVGRGIGLILSAISGFVAFGGAVMGFKESGGEFSDLTDMDKIKASFGSGGSSSGQPTSPPPPPPPGMAPPPPPPPPPPG
jgi:hypothetical protein